MVRWRESDVFVGEKKEHGEPPFLLAFCRFLDMCKVCEISSEIYDKLCYYIKEKNMGTIVKKTIIMTDLVQSSSNTCKSYLIKIYSQQGKFLNAI